MLIGERLEHHILLIRGQKVLLDSDLAALYGVPTKALNQAVRRNAARFPADFMFELTVAEKDELLQDAPRLDKVRYSPSSPLVFTEQGIAMLSTVLRSPRAIAVNIEIMRAFVRLRRLITAHDELGRRLDGLERRFSDRTEEHDRHIQKIYEVLDELLLDQEEKNRPRIGFRAPAKAGPS